SLTVANGADTTGHQRMRNTGFPGDFDTSGHRRTARERLLISGSSVRAREGALLPDAITDPHAAPIALDFKGLGPPAFADSGPLSVSTTRSRTPPLHPLVQMPCKQECTLTGSSAFRSIDPAKGYKKRDLLMIESSQVSRCAVQAGTAQDE